MKSMNRQLGRFMKKGSVDTADTAVMLNEYEEADKVLSKIIEASKSWRDSWVSILATQLGTTTTFEELYNPIPGSTSGPGHEPTIIPEDQLERISKLNNVYAELKNDLMEEVNMMDARIIRPAADAKVFIQPVKKIIKKRENKRLDWQMYTDRVNGYKKNFKRTDRENTALSKAEEEMAHAADVLKLADDHLRQILPPIISAVFSILPHLLGVQIMIQNTLLAQYYTALHIYCEEISFPSPPPPMDNVIATWRRDFKPTQQRVEAINCIARGKAIHQPMTLIEKGSTMTGLNIRNGIQAQRPSFSALTSSRHISPTHEAGARRESSESSSALALLPDQEKSGPNSHTDYSGTKTVSSFSTYPPAGSQGDSSQKTITGKKKPPPPPPKRAGSHKPMLYVTAEFSFEAQNDGDLSFKDGDVIRVIKKTDSTDDWWEGELRGRKGSFPANYCRIS